MCMGGGMNEIDGRMTRCGTMACALAILVANANISHAFAGKVPGHPATLALSVEGDTLIAAAPGLTFSVEDIEAEPGKDAPIAIVLPTLAELRDAGAQEGTFILIRNIPEGVSVSAGMATGRIWVVPLREAGTLRLVTKSGLQTQFQLGFHLIGPNNRILAESTVSVAVRPRERVTATSTQSPKLEAPKPEASNANPTVLPAPKPDSAAKPVRPTVKVASLPPEEEAVLLARGKEVLQQGGIAAARLLFEELATRGSAVGALALARSFDPVYVPHSPSAALAPNIDVAMKWYQRAAELGNPDAQRRLAEIAPAR